jgi:hypothetical protein
VPRCCLSTTRSRGRSSTPGGSASSGPWAGRLTSCAS